MTAIAIVALWIASLALAVLFFSGGTGPPTPTRQRHCIVPLCPNLATSGDRCDEHGS